MCGRYEIGGWSLVNLRWQLDEIFGTPEPNDDVRPTNQVPVVRLEDGRRIGRVMRWGLVPPWAKDAKSGYATFNARGEEVATKASFRQAVKAGRRCILPAAAFFEWRQLPVLMGSKAKKGPKEKTRIVRADHEPIALAGLWESWRDPATLENILSCTIITCTPSAEMASIHDRMPVILDAVGRERWLDPAMTAADSLALLVPAPEGTLVATAVAST